MTHGISRGYDAFPNPQLLWDTMQKVAAMQDRLWVCTLHDGLAYAAERDTIQIEVKQDKKGDLVITPSMPLAKELFTHPLTLVVDASITEATQGKKRLAIASKDGKSLIDFDPHGGKINLKTQR